MPEQTAMSRPADLTMAIEYITDAQRRLEEQPGGFEATPDLSDAVNFVAEYLNGLVNMTDDGHLPTAPPGWEWFTHPTSKRLELRRAQITGGSLGRL